MRPPPAEVALYRSALDDVATVANGALLASWRSFDLADAAAAQAGLRDTLPRLIEDHHLMAAGVAADWYDLIRAQLASSRRGFAAVMAEAPDRGRADALAGWAVGPLYSGAPEPGKALTRAAGGLQRTILAGARDTILGSTRRDPARPRWARVTSGGCDWCEMLADRGAVYASDTVSFEAHDWCGCSAVPDF